MTAENLRHAGRRVADDPASMRPRPMTAENAGGPAARRADRRFNEAAADDRGKLVTHSSAVGPCSALQ